MNATTKNSSLKPKSPGFLAEVNSRLSLTRDAQTTTPCAVPEAATARAAAIEVVMRVSRMRGHRDAIIMDLLLFSGVRVSEACNILPEHILNEKQVYIHGLKGSADRICTLQVMTDFDVYKYRLSWQWNTGLNRWYVYRMCKEFGVYEQILGNKNLAVTHAGRHELIMSLQKAGLDSSQIAQVMGHKRVESTEHYLKHRPVDGMVMDSKKI